MKMCFRKYLFLFLACFALSSLADAKSLTAGQDYVVLPGVQKTTAAKPLVIEFFSYGCPACFHAEKEVEAWALKEKDKVIFKRIPVVFHAEWEMYAKAYYIAEELGLMPEANAALFDAIQVQRLSLNSNEAMINFFINTLKSNPELTRSAFEHSMSIDFKLRDGMIEAGQLGVNQIPTFIVNGRYKTDLMMTKSPGGLVETLSQLASK